MRAGPPGVRRASVRSVPGAVDARPVRHRRGVQGPVSRAPSFLLPASVASTAT